LVALGLRLEDFVFDFLVLLDALVFFYYLPGTWAELKEASYSRLTYPRPWHYYISQSPVVKEGLAGGWLFYLEFTLKWSG